MQEEIIKKYFYAANAITIHEMYLNKFTHNEELTLSNLKENNPGHLGTSMSINFILANLYYYLNSSNQSNKIIIGTGHAGVSLMANLWLNGTLEKYNTRYRRNTTGLNNLINDFGNTIRSEINPEYPTTIYDGGELGYSLGVAYGYAINSDATIVPCIIGDGECESGTISSSWQLSRLLNTKSKVLPIINLNGLKMGGKTYLSLLTNDELKQYFTSLGYQTFIVDATNQDVDSSITAMQQTLKETTNYPHPLIIFKSLKGYTISEFEGNVSVHKNPLQGLSYSDKLVSIKNMLTKYPTDIFDGDGNLSNMFDKFKINDTITPYKKIKSITINDNLSLDEYLYNLLSINNGLVFSPDEIYSNKFNRCGNIAIEILNENLLEALYQGYTMAGNVGFYVAYEGFMPIISSMISQYYKYLKQKSLIKDATECSSLNYLLTSTCWENTYSHQNPDFVNSLLEKKDSFYNIIYPKDKNSAIKYLDKFILTKDKINILTVSKRHQKIYSQMSEKLSDIEIIKDCENPDLILIATGDYMLDTILDASTKLSSEGYNIKVIYVTKPQILATDNIDSLDKKSFSIYFNESTPSIYLYCGYASTIKSLLFERNIDCTPLGYNDEISVFDSFKNNSANNKISVYDIIELSRKLIANNNKCLKLRRKNHGK